MHAILEQFLDRWVWPTMPGAPGAEFRLRLTKEKCVKGWEISLQRTLGEIEEELGREDETWKKERALRGYAAEGVHMSIKQMSGQLLSVDIADQERYIDLQRMRARQIWDECKHSKLHADVLLGKGWIKDERELMDIAQANMQPLPAYFGMSMMFPHIHPLARAAQNYYQEANACIGIMAYLDRVDDPLVRSAASDEGADRLRDLQFLRPLPRSVPGIGHPADVTGTAALIRSAGDEMHRLRRVPRILPGAWRTGAIRAAPTLPSPARGGGLGWGLLQHTGRRMVWRDNTN
jgi:hypothetical protein